MTEETQLEDALSGATETPAEQPPVEEVKQEEPAEEPKGDNITVPLAALHSVRDDNKSLKAELEAVKAQISAPKAEPEIVPDPIDDPNGFAAYTQRQIQQGVTAAQQDFQSKLLDMSEAGAVKVHGQDAVESAKEWFLKQPISFQQEGLQKADPYDYAVQEHKRSTLTAQLTSDPDKLDRVLKLLEGKEEPKVVPTSTIQDQSVGARKGPEWTGPTPLDQIL